MRNIYLIEARKVSFGRVELWKVHEFYQIRCKGIGCETTQGARDFKMALEMYNRFN